MTTFSLKNVSRAEQTAIRGQLGHLGVKVDSSAQELDASLLSGTPLDPATLEAAAKAQGRPGELDLALVKKLVEGVQPPSAADQLRIQAARATQQNMVQRAATVAEELGALSDSAELPSKAQLGKLAAQATKIQYELDSIWRDDQKLGWLEPSEVEAIGSSATKLVTALAAFEHHAAGLVQALEAPPTPTYAQLLSTLNRNGLDIGGWAGCFMGDATLFAKMSQECRQRQKELLGLDDATFDAHFSIVKQDGYSRSEPAIRTTQPIDLDLSGRGLEFLGYFDWLEHSGNLNLAGNELRGTWGLPEVIHGSLSLADNAFQELGSTFDRPVRIEGDLDLSHNRNLRSLDGHAKIEVTGDVNLVGVPATSLPSAFGESLVFGGKLILHATQHELISSAEYRGYAFQIVGEDTPETLPPLPPDPAALLKDPEAAWALEPRQLRQVIGAVDYHERLAIADGLIPEARGQGDHAAKAYRLLDRLSYQASNAVFAEEAALLPTDPKAPLPAELANLPTWKLQALIGPASELDHESELAALKAKQPKTMSYPPAPHFEMPRGTRLLGLLLERARQGEPISHKVHVMDGADRTRAALEILAHQVLSVRQDKGLSWVKLKGSPVEQLASELWTGLPAQVLSEPQELERIAQRLPKNKAFAQLLKTEARQLDLLRAAIVDEQLAVLAEPRPALAAALTAVRGITPASTPEQAAGAVALIRKQLPMLSEIERGALLQDLDSQDVLVLAKAGPGPAIGEVRLTLAQLGLELYSGLDYDRKTRAAQRVAEQAVELLYNHPTIGPAAEAHANAVFDALHGATLGQTLVKLSWVLGQHDRGKLVLERQLDRLVDTATEPESIYALAATRYSQLIMPRKEALLAQLKSLPAQGDLGEAVARVLERLES